MEKFIPISEPYISDLELEFVSNAVKSGWVSSIGEYIDEFENKFASFCGTKYALATSNGTTALHLSLLSLGIKEGDEVILPDFTFVATANAIKYVGANPVFVDINPDTLCISPNAILNSITSKTKAIIPVHIYGHPANMIEIMNIASQNGLYVIEDCAEAHGAEINNKKVGSFGHIGVFSFYGNKIMTTGEGGIITTNNEIYYENAKQLRDHAMSKTRRYWHERVGYNYRITNIQAALGCAQLSNINKFIDKRISNFLTYHEELKGIDGIKLNFTSPGIKDVFWMIRLELENYEEKDRNDFMIKLKQKGIDSRPYFYPISDMPMYKASVTPVTHSIYKKGINLPTYYNLSSENIKYICSVIKSILG